MSDPEFRLFESFTRSADNFLEFGSGGSTCVAARLVKGSVTSVDSSTAWLDKVGQTCEAREYLVKPALIYVDIGPTGNWGVPTDPSTRARWPDYYETVWLRPASFDADLYFVDGRFRVACMMKTLLQCRTDAIVMVHDFANRPHYQVIREVAREIARSETLSAFLPRPGQCRGRIMEILNSHRFDSA